MSVVSVVWQRGSRSIDAASRLLSEEVGRLIGVPAETVRLSRSCRRCGSTEHGRPVVLPTFDGPTPFISLSRAADTCVVAVSTCGPVGVDVERRDSTRFAGFDSVALNPYELAPNAAARATTWVRKESLLKATGHGLQVDPRLIRLTDPDQPPRLLEWSALDPPQKAAWMQDLPIVGHAASLTALTDVAPRLTLRREAPAGVPR